MSTVRVLELLQRQNESPSEETKEIVKDKNNNEKETTNQYENRFFAPEAGIQSN